ncbi:MAG: trigger factor [Chlamydiia bacterium]|nr:trigger factor [Chlamydiia bacterium]
MTEPKEYKSDTVTFTIERKPECMVEYKVKSSPEVVKKARRTAIKSVSKEVSLPGFRKGRAPDHLIVKKFPKPLEEQWQKAIADETFRECQKLAHTPLLSHDAQINFNIAKHSLEEGAELTYSFETEPLVPEIDLSSLEIEEIKRESVDAKKVDSTLEDIQMFFAEWEKISDRNVKEGDYILVDVDIIEEDPPQKALQNARFEVTKAKMAKWMHDLVIDMKIGESKEGVSQPDEEASEEEKKATPPKKVRLILKSIEKPKLPPVDDALAQKMGAKTAAEMKGNLEKLLNKQAEEHVQRGYREQINELLIEKYPFELPKTLLQRETQFRIKQLVNDPSFQKKMMAMSEEERKKAIEDIHTQGERAVRLFYISRKLIQDHKIQVSPSEVHQGVKTPLEAMFSDQSDLYTAKEDSQEQKAIAMSRLILTKAEDFLISKAKVVPPKPKKEAAPKKTAAKKAAPKKDAAPKKTTTAKKAAPKKATTAKKSAPKKKSTKNS